MRRLLPAFLLLTSVALFAAEPKTPAQLFNDGTAAYKKHDYAGYLAAMDALTKLRPNQPLFLFDHAGALALNHQPELAVAELERVAAMKVSYDLADHDFDSIRARADFQAVAQKIEAMRTERIGDGSIAYTLPKGLLTEAIAYDSKSHSFFVSAVRQRKILRIDATGKVSDFVPSGGGGIWGVNGIVVDPVRRLVWVSSSPSPRIEGYDAAHEGECSLIAFNADTGARMVVYSVPKAEKHFFDDISLGPDGSVYISDSAKGALLRMQLCDKDIDPFVPAGTFVSPQGSVVVGKWLYVSDYGGAIFAVDLVTGNATRLELPPDFAAYGIDGLAASGRSLIGVQNGLEPSRVVRLRLSEDGLRITRWSILEMGDPILDEPTIGVVAGDSYYFNAASQGHLFDVKPPQIDKAREGIVMKVKLAP